MKCFRKYGGKLFHWVSLSLKIKKLGKIKYNLSIFNKLLRHEQRVKYLDFGHLKLRKVAQKEKVVC